jgi:glycosyltransferase involved in cell wall biosynthesis
LPLFSVIIPTKDRPHFLMEAIASVLAQSHSDFELLVVNDGDPLPPLPQDTRIRHLENAHRGAVLARNFGVAAARGSFIAFLDDDDRWTSPHHLQLGAAALGQGAAFTFSDGTMQFPGEARPRLFAQDATAASLACDNTILVSAVCYRKALHRTLGAFDVTLPYYWDWDWYLRVARSGARLQHLPEVTVDIRIHGQNMSGEQTRQARQDNLDALSIKHGLGQLTLKNHTDFV